MVKVCPECGAENPDDAVYCESCYAKLEPLKNPVWREEIIPGKAKKKSEESAPPEGGAEEPQTEDTQPVISKDEAVKMLKEVKALIKEAKAQGKDVTEAQNIFMQAKPALDAGDYARVAEIVNRIREML